MNLANIKRTFDKTWDTLKEVINKKTFKSDFPSNFLHDGVEITGSKNIADKFNEYFIEIGPKLARSIDTANKAPFDSDLTTPCAASFNFTYISPDDTVKVIHNLRPKSSVGYDNISTKLLKVKSRPLSIINNQSLCTGIFPDKLKLRKWFPYTRKTTINHLGITVRYHYFPPYQKFSNGLLLTSYAITLHLMVYSMKASMDSANTTVLN